MIIIDLLIKNELKLLFLENNYEETRSLVKENKHK